MSAAIAKTQAVWTPFIAAQATAMEEFLTEHGVSMDEKMRADILQVLEQQTDDYGNLFKKHTPKTKSTKATKATKAKVVDEADICCALTFKAGAPVRCTRKCAPDEGGYCRTHSKQCGQHSGKPRYGRYDEEVPLTYTTYGPNSAILKKDVRIPWTTPELVARADAAGLGKSKSVGRPRKTEAASGAGADDAASVTSSKSKGKGKRAPSAYNLFMKDPANRAKVEGSAKEKMSALAAMWKEADAETKRPYQEKAAELKSASKETMDDAASVTSTSTTESKKSTGKKEKKLTAYQLFKAENGHLGDLKTIKQAWKDADKDTRKRYTNAVKKEQDVQALASQSESETKPALPSSPPSEPVEVDMGNIEEATMEDDEMGDVSSLPKLTHKESGKAYHYDRADGSLYDAETQEFCSHITALGGEENFE